ANERREMLPWATVKGWLNKPRQPSFRKLLSDFTLSPDRWMENDENPDQPLRWLRAQDTKATLGSDLPLWKLLYRGQGLKAKDDKPQRRFLIEVRLVVEDTYTEGERKNGVPVPHVTTSGETFTFVVVPENELLARIGEEE